VLAFTRVRGGKMIFKKKIPKFDKVLLDKHKRKIIKRLEFGHEPVVLYGDLAFDFIREYVPGYHNKSDEQILCDAGGYFIYRNLPKDCINTGVVCIFNGEIGTLAHELCHAKQYQDKSKWLHRGIWLKCYYKLGYAFYPTEREAFRFAITYLKETKQNKLAYFYIKKYRNTKIWTIALPVILAFLLALLWAISTLLIIKYM
jgi:hypothetical protein